MPTGQHKLAFIDDSLSHISTRMLFNVSLSTDEPFPLEAAFAAGFSLGAAAAAAASDLLSDTGAEDLGADGAAGLLSAAGAGFEDSTSLTASCDNSMQSALQCGLW